MPFSALSASDMPGWPVGGGECGRLIRRCDWSTTTLGPIERWSTVLRVTVQTLLNSPVPQVLMWGRDGVMLYNDGYAAIADDRHPEALGCDIRSIWPEAWDWNAAVLARGFAGEVATHRNQSFVVRRGDVEETLTFDLYYTPIRDEAGAVAGVLGTVIDNTARLGAESRLARSLTEVRSIGDALPVLIAYIDRNFRYRFANAYYKHWMARDPEWMLGRTVAEVLGEEMFALRRPLMERALAGERIVSDVRLTTANRRDRRLETHYLPRTDADGRVTGLYLLAFDVEDRARREEELDRSIGRFRAAIAAMHGVLWTNSPDGRMLGEQPGWAALTGQSEEEYQDHGWARALHPDDAAPTIAEWERSVATLSAFEFEHRVRRRDGVWRNFAVRAVPIVGMGGEVVEWVGVHTDITEQREAERALTEQAALLRRQVEHRQRAEAQLRQLNDTLETRIATEIAERHQAEAALAQAQKMETIGQLTGGVAHDFNNLLQVVSGNLQLLGREVAGNPVAERRVTSAMAGVERGAKLAAQLLAFGRRQALEPRIVNVTRFVHGMHDILRRAIGEGVAIDTIVSEGLWNTFIDPAQIENAILNLAINARDAMAGHGRLTITVANTRVASPAASADEVAAGDYVELSVGDTGSGMTPDVMARVFEPFFSTKAEGKGSGLGLSMVYGFVKQSGGHVRIDSTPGRGTTVQLLLPRAFGAEDAERAVDERPVAGGTETVLVVEDDDDVRATVVGMLEELGYRVLTAGDPDAGLAMVQGGATPDLLFTDVVMPGTIDSADMARRMREHLPDLSVLFTSGYAESAIVHGGRLDLGVELLAKPYSREALARRVRQVLGPPARAAVVALLVEDDPTIRAQIQEVLADAGFEVMVAGSAEEAIELTDRARATVLVTDVNLPGASGVELAATIRAERPGIGIVFATGDGAVALPEDGATAILRKPYGVAALVRAVRTVIDQPPA